MNDTLGTPNSKPPRGVRPAKGRHGHDLRISKAVLESTNEGFAVWDAKLKLVAWSKKCPDLWYEPEDILRPGMPMVELLQHIAINGGFGPGDPDNLARRELRRIRKAGKGSDDEFEMRDGRVIHVQRNAMPDGGHTSTYTDISERRRAEAALRESKERYQTLFHQSPLGITVEDYSDVKRYIDRLRAEGVDDFATYFRDNGAALVTAADKVRLIDANDTMVRMFGTASFDEYKQFEDDFVRADVDIWREFYINELAAFASGDVNYTGETSDLLADGTTIEVRCVSRIMESAKDNWSQIISTHEDISEHRRSEEIVKQSETRLRQSAKMAQIGYWVWDDIEERTISCSVECAGIHGVSVDEYLSYTNSAERDASWTHTDDRDFFIKANRDALEDGTYLDIEYRIVTPKGDIRWVRDISEPEFDEDGVVVRTLGSIQDITERKRAEQALGDSQARYRQAVELTSVGHWVWDEVNNKCIFCSEEMARIHGVSIDEFLASTSSLEGNINWAHPDDRERVALVFIDAAEKKSDFDVEYRINTRTGEVRHVREIGKAVFDEDGTYVRSQGVLQDITDQEEARISLQTALADAEQANHAKSEFLATMSHEFRTPLNAILGFSEMLRAQYFGPLGAKNYEEYSGHIHDSGEHMLALVNDMLDIAAIEAGKRTTIKEAIDVEEVLRGCINDVEQAAKKAGIVLSLEVPDDLPSLYADKRSIVQVILNLLSNAIKFTERDGTVSVSVSTSNREMTIRVSDTGIGIEPDRLSKITEPFSQAQDNSHITQNGTGLGLSIVKTLVEMHEGELSIESEIDKGTIVAVMFPIQSVETE